MKKVCSIILTVVLCAALCFAVSAEKDPNTWLCKAGGPFPTGWWMGTVIDANVPSWNIDVNFITPNAFDGFVMACYAGAEPSAKLKIDLLDNNGGLLESVNTEIVGDHENDEHGFVQVHFSKAYAKGTYTIRFIFVEGSYFVLGSAAAGDTDVSIAGNGVKNDATLDAPAIALYGAEAPSGSGDDETKAENPGTETETKPADTQPADNPKTSDAAILAIAAIAVTALAGAFISKKIK